MDFSFTSAIPHERSVPFREPADCLGQGRDFGASSIRRTCEHTRNHSRTLDAAGEVSPYMARCELPPTTALRAGTHAKYSSRVLPAYGHCSPQTGEPFPYVEDEVPGAVHRSISRPYIPVRHFAPTASHSGLRLQVPLDVTISSLHHPSAVLDRKIVAMITGTPRLSTRQHQLKDGRTTYPRQAGTLQWLYTST